MDEIEILIKEINKKLTPKKAYDLEQKVLKILNDENIDTEIKNKILNEAYLEPLAMMASCYEPSTQK